jgi:hypothetical protein
MKKSKKFLKKKGYWRAELIKHKYGTSHMAHQDGIQQEAVTAFLFQGRL